MIEPQTQHTFEGEVTTGTFRAVIRGPWLDDMNNVRLKIFSKATKRAVDPQKLVLDRETETLFLVTE